MIDRIWVIIRFNRCILRLARRYTLLFNIKICTYRTCNTEWFYFSRCSILSKRTECKIVSCRYVYTCYKTNCCIYNISIGIIIRYIEKSSDRIQINGIAYPKCGSRTCLTNTNILLFFIECLKTSLYIRCKIGV